MPCHQLLAILIALRLYRAGRIGSGELYHRIACSYCRDFDKRKVYTMFEIREKLNPLALHAICETLERAQRWIGVNAVEYCANGYFMDKTLTQDSFVIVKKGGA